MMRLRWWMGFGLLVMAGCGEGGGRNPEWTDFAPDVRAEPVRGHLTVATDGASPGDESAVMRMVVVPGQNGYTGMEDNDLRGYLDGVFKWGWNQPGQVHVRIGRREVAPLFGELELFRVLHRWADLPSAPPGGQLTDAALSVFVEAGVARDVRLMLYAVERDWNPGQGGVDGDNVSPPRPGEVWWNDVGFETEAWGLPGAGFASDGSPEADTPTEPLADAEYEPGDEAITFQSIRLTRYLADRVADGTPARFLLKLADYDEDTPGMVLNVYSASHGDSRTLTRRPRLTFDWLVPATNVALSRPVLLEYGRTLALPPVPSSGVRRVAVDFTSDDAYTAPTIEIRGGVGAEISEWRDASIGTPVGWDWWQIRLLAGELPVPFGQAFEARFEDTWVRTAPPEVQEVPWTFVSPTGAVDTVMAEYQGDFNWVIRYEPRELGRYMYRWTHTLAEQPYESAAGRFDVVVRSREHSRDALAFFEAAVDNSEERPATERMRLAVSFARLERALMQWESPETFRSDEGRVLRDRLRSLRATLSGQPVPDPIPFRPSPTPY